MKIGVRPIRFILQPFSTYFMDFFILCLPEKLTPTTTLDVGGMLFTLTTFSNSIPRFDYKIVTTEIFVFFQLSLTFIFRKYNMARSRFFLSYSARLIPVVVNFSIVAENLQPFVLVISIC